MVQVGDSIYIMDYGNPNDEELIQWAYEQDKECFKVQEVNLENQVFYIEDCEYGIPFGSVDYVVKRG